MFDATRYGPLASFDAGIARQLYDLHLLAMARLREFRPPSRLRSLPVCACT